MPQRVRAGIFLRPPDNWPMWVSMIKEVSDPAYHVFREPPWNDDLEAPRLHFGLGVDLMRRNAKAWIAWSKPASKVVGYILGYEAVLQSDNARDLSLRDICGTDALNYLFEGATRVFYEDTLCVDPRCRRQQIAQKLSFALDGDLRERVERASLARRLKPYEIEPHTIRSFAAHLPRFSCNIQDVMLIQLRRLWRTGG